MVLNLEQSLLYQYWHVFLPLFLVLASFWCLRNTKDEDVTVNKKKVGKLEDLDGADLVAGEIFLKIVCLKPKFTVSISLR